MNCPHCKQEIYLHQHDAEVFRKGWQAGNKAGLEVREPLVKELENIRNAKPEEWRRDFGEDIFRQFTRWAQNRAAHALDALAKVKEEGKNDPKQQ